MVALSAADALSPAIQRTQTFLFRPFRWGTFLKLCLVAIVTEGIGANFNLSHAGHHGGPVSGAPMHPHFALTPPWIALIVAASLAVLLIGFVILYLVTRLRFAFFHCLIHNVREIRPGWHLYRSQATRFFWLNVVVGLCFLLIAGFIALLFGTGIFRLVRQSQATGHLDLGLLLTLVLPLIPIALLLALAAFITDLVLRDWMLPHYALENATARAAWAAVWARIRAEKGGFFAYALLRVIVPIMAVIALAIVLFFPSLVLAGLVALIEVAIHATFTHATGASALTGVLLQVFFGLIAFGLAIVIALSLGGPLSTAVREYALLFYGGRYPLLGNILFPPPPGVSIPAPGTT